MVRALAEVPRVDTPRMVAGVEDLERLIDVIALEKKRDAMGAGQALSRDAKLAVSDVISGADPRPAFFPSAPLDLAPESLRKRGAGRYRLIPIDPVL